MSIPAGRDGGTPPITVAPPVPRVGPVARAFRTLLSGDPQGTPDWVAALATGDRDCLVEPDGPSWAVHGSLTTLVGGVRALMLQSQHPAAVTGVAEHSAFEDDTVGRLRRTTRWLIVTTFGDVATATRASAGIRRMHERVTGTYDAALVGGAPGTTAAYSASDADLLRWVHDAFTDSFLTAHLELGGTPIPGGPDAYVAEWAVSAELLGATGLPTTRAELTAQLDEFRRLPGYGRAPATREVARFLRDPALPLAFRGPYRVLASAAAATLDERDAALLGLRQNRVSIPVARAGLHALLWALSATSPAERAARLRLGLPPR